MSTSVPLRVFFHVGSGLLGSLGVCLYAWSVVWVGYVVCGYVGVVGAGALF